MSFLRHRTGSIYHVPIVQLLLREHRRDLGLRYATMSRSVRLASQLGAKSVVETGCIRQAGAWSDGQSTLFLASCCKDAATKLHTVDADARCVALCRVLAKLSGLPISASLMDSVAYLKQFGSQIDWLYLDSLDSHQGPVRAQRHQLREIQAAYPKLAARCIVLLDDNGAPNGGKTRLSKNFLSDHGFRCILDSYQSLWTR